MTRIAALIVAAGKGERAGGGTPKQYREIRGRAVLARSVSAFLSSQRITEVVVCIRDGDRARYASVAPDDNRMRPPVIGAASRAGTVRAGLEVLAEDPPDFVLIHDAARPFVTSKTIEAVIDALSVHQGAFAATPVFDSLRVIENGEYARPLPRDGVWRAETPQGFKFGDILDAHRNLDDVEATDDVEIARRAGMRVKAVASDGDNFKITAPEDFTKAERRLSEMLPDIRVGHGFDVHAFDEGDAVVLCGVAIPHDRSLNGHSDADVAMHALTDAIFGAIAEGDIGRWFPPSDPRWKGAASSIFLAKAVERVRDRGGELANADVTIICERPKVGPHAEAMAAELARILDIAAERINVKATTSERLGFTGREEGIAAMATATVRLP